jgi:hypothetical protein
MVQSAAKIYKPRALLRLPAQRATGNGAPGQSYTRRPAKGNRRNHPKRVEPLFENNIKFMFYRCIQRVEMQT